MAVRVPETVNEVRVPTEVMVGCAAVVTVPAVVAVEALPTNAPVNVVADTVVNAPVEAVVEPIAPGAANVAPFKEDAFKLATFVVDDTTNGAVPVDTVEVN